MTPIEDEFIQLKARFKQAMEYEKTKYPTDTRDGKEWAEKEFIKIVNRMAELWEQMIEEEREKHIDMF